MQLVCQDKCARASRRDDSGMCLLLGLGEESPGVTEIIKGFLVKVWNERFMNVGQPAIP